MGAPVGWAVQGALAADLNEGVAVRTGTVGATVDPQASARRRIAAGGYAVGLSGARVFEQEAPGSHDQPLQRGIIKRRHARPRIDRLGKQDFAFEDVADAGHGPLIEQRLSDFELGPRLQALKGDGDRI